MNISRISINNNCNYTFKASVTSELRDEIVAKGAHLEKLRCKDRSQSLTGYISYVKEIANTFPEANVGIDKENPSQYVVKYRSQKIFIPRNKDKEYYQYKSLREGLNNLAIIWNLSRKTHKK